MARYSIDDFVQSTGQKDRGEGFFELSLTQPTPDRGTPPEFRCQWFA